MSQTEMNLDQMLAGMAEDVPPMPADFHDKWMNAVRAEAKQADAPVPIPVRQWPRILSIAAVFVFLIGGTFIYRSVRKPVLPDSEPVNAAAVTETETTEKGAGTAVFEAAGAVKDEDYSVGTDLTGMTAARKDTAKTAEAASTVHAEEEADATVEVDMADESDAEYEAEAYEAATPAAETAETNAAGIKTPASEAPAAETSASGASGTVPAERQGIAGFFTDMGDFLLGVWPYLLIAVVPLIVAAGVKKFRKK